MHTYDALSGRATACCMTVSSVFPVWTQPAGQGNGMSADHQDGAHDAQEFGQLSLSVAGSPLRTYWLTLSRTTIGRRATNTLVLDDLTVSGEHAVLLVGLQDVVIQDLGSRNGTLLNGRPVARALLSDGDSHRHRHLSAGLQPASYRQSRE